MMGQQRLIDNEIRASEQRRQYGVSADEQHSIRFIEDKRNVYDAYENSGVLIFAMQDLFDRIEELNSNNRSMGHSFASDCRQFEVRVSYLEIYNELVYDLLGSEMGEQALQINEARDKEFVVKGATEIPVLSIQEVL